ncbi:CD99 antigen-like protein 2 isoform X2 [Heptranchias perlo]|uniref:CD99 antigen-like protein 2 isoform X2 n=1 Tax=Heptranchias perlo TaxID=212740 RepID=UPI003559C3C7
MLLLKSLLFVCLTFVFVRTNEDDGFDLSDALEGEHTEPWDDHDGFDLNDALKDGPTKPLRNDDGFDLSEALNDDPIKPAGGDFSDSDLQDVVDGDYKADKTNSKGQDPPTPLDLISDLVMVVIGGTSEQIKRLCLSLLEMLTEQYSNAQDQ